MERYASYAVQLKDSSTEAGKHLLLGAYALIDVLIVLGYIAYHLGQDLAQWVDEQRTVSINELDITMDEVNTELDLQERNDEQPTLPRASVMSAYRGDGEFNYGGDVLDEVAYEVVNSGQALKLAMSKLRSVVDNLTGKHVEPEADADAEEEVLPVVAWPSKSVKTAYFNQAYKGGQWFS